jgi:uncharacterized protein (DUF111 family)
MPLMKTAAIGLGAGTREGGGHPNILRIFTGEQAASGVASEQLLRVETNIDDMNPQIYPYLIEKLLVAGALDAYCVPAVMKKGRPAIVFSVLCREEKLGEIFSILISETTSLGARISRVERLCIDRRVETVETAFGAIKIKIGIMDGRAVNVMPEYEDCAAAAARCGAPLAAVMEAARAAAGK